MSIKQKIFKNVAEDSGEPIYADGIAALRSAIICLVIDDLVRESLLFIKIQKRLGNDISNLKWPSHIKTLRNFFSDEQLCFLDGALDPSALLMRVDRLILSEVEKLN